MTISNFYLHSSSMICKNQVATSHKCSKTIILLLLLFQISFSLSMILETFIQVNK